MNRVWSVSPFRIRITNALFNWAYRLPSEHSRPRHLVSALMMTLAIGGVVRERCALRCGIEWSPTLNAAHQSSAHQSSLVSDNKLGFSIYSPVSSCSVQRWSRGLKELLKDNRQRPRQNGQATFLILSLSRQTNWQPPIITATRSPKDIYIYIYKKKGKFWVTIKEKFDEIIA